MKLFYSVELNGTSLAADYTVGDTTLDLVDASGLERMLGSTGCVAIQPRSGGAAVGSPFYLTYTGRTGNQLTGVSEDAVGGTTAADALTGSDCHTVAYLSGHPFNLVRQILCSGSGTGAYDVLPDGWGLCLPDNLWDHVDVNAWMALVQPLTGSLAWELFVAAPVDDAIAWLQGLLSAAGLWIAQRQGKLTMRAALALDTLDWSVTTITEDDISEKAWAWNDLDPTFSAEYGTVVSTAEESDSGYPASSVQTTPALGSYTYDLSQVLWGDVAARLDEASSRLGPWLTRPPERFRLPCVGWRLAGLTPGDPVLLNLPRLRGRLTAFSQQYVLWPAIVASVTPDFNGHGCVVEVWPQLETP
jgi:hypothetical protein